MASLLWLLLLTSFALMSLSQVRYAKAKYPKSTGWMVMLFASGWFVGASLAWLIIGTVGTQQFFAALLFGLPMGYVSMRWLPFRYRIVTEEAERNRRRQ